MRPYVLALFLSGSAVCYASEAPTDPTPAKTGDAAAAPAPDGSTDRPSTAIPQTETERLLLERIEKLEKRLADVESGRGAAPPAGAPATPPAAAPLAAASPTLPATSVGIAAPRLASTAPPSGAAFASTLPSAQAAPAADQQATVSNEQPPPPAEPELSASPTSPG